MHFFTKEHAVASYSDLREQEHRRASDRNILRVGY